MSRATRCHRLSLREISLLRAAIGDWKYGDRSWLKVSAMRFLYPGTGPQYCYQDLKVRKVQASSFLHGNPLPA